MKVERYQLLSFEQGYKDGLGEVFVPESAEFLQASVLHDGIYVWYAIPEIVGTATKSEKFMILKPEQSIPDKGKFITILDTIVEVPDNKGIVQQGIMVFPIYKL